MSIVIKCDEVENIEQGHFREPLLRVTVDDVCTEYLISQLDAGSVLDCIDDDEIVDYVKAHGLAVYDQ